MLTYDPTIPRAKRRLLEAAAAEVWNRVERRSGLLPSDLLRRLEELLGQHADSSLAASYPPHALIAYDPWGDRDTPVARGPYAYTGGVSIWICERAFLEQRRQGNRRVAAVLLHELVHLLCGSELDAEAFEHLLFATDGAMAPDAGDWEGFRACNLRGRWVRIDTRRTPPQLTDHAGRRLGPFPAPPGDRRPLP
jgi:hypothetical protein